MIILASQAMPVSPALPEAVSAASSAVANIPENSQVLVVMDYEPALAGEMEAVSGPLLDQIVLLRHPQSIVPLHLTERLCPGGTVDDQHKDQPAIPGWSWLSRWGTLLQSGIFARWRSWCAWVC